MVHTCNSSMEDREASKGILYIQRIKIADRESIKKKVGPVVS